jgi:DNA uptake protein ComE-like DNA-binding protein
MKSAFMGQPSIHASKIVVAIVFVLGGLLAADAAPQKTGSADPSAAGRKNSRKEKVSPDAVAVDLNNASEKDLDSLPGIGPATAKKIIDHRPYQSVDDLAKAGVAAKEIERMRPMVTVGKSPASSAGGRSVPKESPAKLASPTGSAGSAKRSTPEQVTAPPSGSGMVWVNTETKVYHREGDRWYGKTKHGYRMMVAASNQRPSKSGFRGVEGRAADSHCRHQA